MNDEQLQRETIEHVLERSPRMQEAIESDARLRPLLVKASHEASYADRWITYSTLKREADTIVGFYAVQPKLRTTAHYDAFIDAIDALLPQHENDFVILVPRADETHEEGVQSA